MAVALAAIAAHICVVPGHVHAMPAANGHTHDEPAGDHEDGVHAASCEALRSTSAAPVPLALAGTTTRWADPLPGGIPRALEHLLERPTPASSPPLYLAHHAFLI